MLKLAIPERLCAGLSVQLLSPLFARHHRTRWPHMLANPDATAESHKKSLVKLKDPRGPLIPCRLWAIKCMDGVYRALTKTLPLLNEPSEHQIVATMFFLGRPSRSLDIAFRGGTKEGTRGVNCSCQPSSLLRSLPKQSFWGEVGFASIDRNRRLNARHH